MTPAAALRSILLSLTAVPWLGCQVDEPASRSIPLPSAAQQVELEPVPPPHMERLEGPVRRALETLRAQKDASLVRVPRDDSEAAGAFGELGLAYLAHELHPAAEACLRNAVRLEPQNPRWSFFLGYLLVEQGRFEEALEPLRATLRLDPEDATSAVLLSRSCRQVGCLSEARGELARFLQGSPGSFGILFESGLLALAEGDDATALVRLEEAAQQKPEVGDAWYQLGLLYRSLGRESDARTAFDRSGGGSFQLDDPRLEQLQASVVGYRVANRLGNEAFLTGRFEEAVESFQAALEADPTQARVRVNLAAALGRIGRLDEAEAELRRAVELEPDYGRAHFNLGSILARRGRFQEAQESYRAAIEIDPGDTDARFNLANLLRRVGQFSASAEQYAAVIRLDPASSRARYGLALTLILQERWTEGVEELRRLEQLFPGERPPRSLLARVLAAAPEEGPGDATEALALARALFEEQTSIEHAETLAVALAANGLFDEASAVLGDATRAAERAGQAAVVSRLRSASRQVASGRLPTVLLPWGSETASPPPPGSPETSR